VKGHSRRSGRPIIRSGWLGPLALLIVMIAAPSASDAIAANDRQRNANHCVVSSGVDLNGLFDVPEQIVTGTTPSCSEVGSGERWRPSAIPWFLNQSFEVVPDGFVPAGATPLEDFVAKFAGVRYVVDPGTRRERTYAFADVDDLWTGTFAGTPLVSPITLAVLKPLPVGDHEVETYWRFSATHCDGFGNATGPQGNCFPAGETQLPTIQFRVTPGHF
jgi:hypothetical protein